MGAWEATGFGEGSSSLVFGYPNGGYTNDDWDGKLFWFIVWEDRRGMGLALGRMAYMIH